MNKRVPLWLPYLSSAKVDSKGIGHFLFNGGEEHVDLKTVASIMIYGDSDAILDPLVIDKICRKGIPIILHRRNMSQSIVICGNGRPDPDDTITHQILTRQNLPKTKHIARTLLNAKFKSCSWLVSEIPDLPVDADIKKLRSIEAVHAKLYWSRFYNALNRPDLTRRASNPYSQSLDAVSKFISGITLRWVTYHHLSPYHGYLHEPSTYPSLIYDLMEPYRGLFEAAILKEWIDSGTEDPKTILAIGINTVKNLLNTQVYVPLTRQIVTVQELIHGEVLSLKFYLLGRQSRFLIPMVGKPNGGRPPKVEFLLYGRHAGRTNFWKAANAVANQSELDAKSVAELLD
jgi:CRISPR/Cas system-associated endonuclease Cas1